MNPVVLPGDLRPLLMASLERDEDAIAILSDRLSDLGSESIREVLKNLVGITYSLRFCVEETKIKFWEAANEDKIPRRFMVMVTATLHLKPPQRYEVTLGEVCTISAERLLETRGAGPKCLKAIRLFLLKYGLCLLGDEHLMGIK